MFLDEDEPEKKKEQFIWVEKYRPKTFNEYVGSDKLKSKIQSFIDEGQIPHLIFHSRSPGTGKSTISKLITSHLDCDSLYINASTQNKIDVVRQKITTFASSLGFRPLKVMILDEAQRLTPDAQRGMLEIMETFAEHTRFILTANNVEKLIEPLRSRCQIFHVQPPEKSIVAKHVAGILDAENVKYEVSDFKVLMKYYPDIRKIIQEAQQNSSNGVLSISEEDVIASDAKLHMVEILKSSKSKKDKLVSIRQLLADNGIAEFTEYFNYLFDTVDEYSNGNSSAAILQLAEYQYKDSFVANKEINFAACVIEILKSI